MNCNSIAGKQAELAHLVEYTDPDVLIMTKTKLDSSISTAELLPPGYQGQIRKDKTRSGGGIMLAFQSCYSVEEIEPQNIDAETAWASVNTGVNKMAFGVFYRPPSHNPSPVEQLENAISQVMTKFKNNPNITYILGGDFNTGDIDWETSTILPNSPCKEANEKVFGLSQLFDLCQIQR